MSSTHTQSLTHQCLADKTTTDADTGHFGGINISNDVEFTIQRYGENRFYHRLHLLNFFVKNSTYPIFSSYITH